MSAFWIVVLVIIAIMVIRSRTIKSIVLEGTVIAKDIAKNREEDSYVTIETADKQKVVLRFDTHDVDILIQIGGESFHGKADELDRAIAVNDMLKVEVLAKDGMTRNVYKLISVSRPS